MRQEPASFPEAESGTPFSDHVRPPSIRLPTRSRNSSKGGKRRGRKVFVDSYPPLRATPSPLPRVLHPPKKSEARDREIERVVAASVKDYRATLEEKRLLTEGASAGVVRPIARKRFSKGSPGALPVIQIFKDEHHTAGIFATILRCFVWIRVFGFFFLGILWDKIRFADSVQRRAERLLKAFQNTGGSAIKIGQQLSMRIDIFPFEYCQELSKLLEAHAPFPTKYAIAAIERATGRPLDETFAAFDPKPIGAASIACVYHGVLKNGERVAIKVRRPNIGKVFATDLRAIKWSIKFAELSSLIRPGYMDAFVSEFSHTILEELDFRMEAYHQMVFGREASRAKRKIADFDFVSAPKVYLELSTQEVLVQEFVSGVWMWEILAAVEHNDEAALGRMRQMQIDPKTVAKRLMYTEFWGQLVSPLYHSDPHPANILVKENNQLVFIDFGAVGMMTAGKKELCVDVLKSMAKKDVDGCVRAFLSFMEPLPPMDTNRLAKELAIELGKVYRRQWSKQAAWYEKTTAAVIFKLFGALQRYDVAANFDTVRGFRSNMLYDTLALRICPELDLVRVSKDFLHDYSASMKKRLRREVRNRMTKGLVKGDYLATLQQVGNVGNKAMQFASRFLERPHFAFNFLIDKAHFMILETVRFVSGLLGITTFACGALAIYKLYHGKVPDFWPIFWQIMKSPVYQFVIGIGAFISTRRIILRLRDPEVD